MRMSNKSRVASCGRRLSRTKGATIAAIAAIFLFAAQAQAGLVNLAIDPGLSTLGFMQEAYELADPSLHLRLVDNDAATSAFYYGGLDPDPSNVTYAWGHIQMLWTPGAFISFLPGHRVNFGKVFPYFPYLNKDASVAENSNVVGPPGGTGVGGVAGKMAQFGFQMDLSLDGGTTWTPEVGVGNLYDLVGEFGTASTTATDGGPPLGFAGGTTYIGGDNAVVTYGGYEDLFGALTGHTDVNGIPAIFAGNLVTFDGTTLTIPMTFHLEFDSDGTHYIIDTFGAIVAHAVPEPSSIFMFGCGIVGLVSCLIRARTRRR
jgi:hypothetical protein